MPDTEKPLWESTTVQNLVRYNLSGTYFGRFRAGGKVIRQSLETTAFSVAKQRLPEKIREYRARHESAKAFAGGKMTVGDAAKPSNFGMIASFRNDDSAVGVANENDSSAVSCQNTFGYRDIIR